MPAVFPLSTVKPVGYRGRGSERDSERGSEEVVSGRSSASLNVLVTASELINPVVPLFLELKRTDLSLSILARGTGLSATYLSRVGNATRTPSLGVAKRLATYLRISIDDLYTALDRVKRNKTNATTKVRTANQVSSRR